MSGSEESQEAEIESLMPTVEEAIQMAEDYPPPADWYDEE